MKNLFFFFFNWKSLKCLGCSLLFFKKIIYFLVGVQLVYNIVLVSTVQQHESAICIHISPFSWASLSPPSHHLGHHRAPSWALCVIYNSSPLASYFTNDSVYARVLSHFSCVRLFETLGTVAHQAPLPVHGILQVRILEWVIMPSSKGSSQPRDQIRVS